MKVKTRLAPVQQLDRTLALALDYFGEQRKYLSSAKDKDLYGHLQMGMMLRPHRLLYPGDLFVFWFSNGGGERWPITAISSKGYKVVDMYLKFRSYFPNGRQRSHSRKNYRNERMAKTGRISGEATWIEQSGQQVKFLDVLGRWSVDPTVQREIVETLRTGSVVCR